jgi:glycosyltransferase involved in cell wall biosynthesis
MPVLLHCIPSLGGGGAERQVVQLSNQLTGRGWQVHIALLNEGPMRAHLRPETTVHRLACNSNYDPRISVRVLALIRRLRPDLVQTWLTQMDVLAGPAARLARRPWIVSERSSEAVYGDAKSRFRALIGRGATAVIANSAGGIDYWKTRNRRHDLQFVVPNALDVDRIAAAAPEMPPQLPPGAPLILAAGRLSAEKNVLTMTDALDRATRATGAVAVVCGQGPQFDDVRARIEQLGAGSRIFPVGFQQHVWGMMKCAAAFVSVSHLEGRPNAVIEAMACGTPLVVSDIPSHREFLDEQCALLVDRHSPDAIAGGIVAAINDQSAARARAAAARLRVEPWSPQNIATQYEDAYRQILAAAGKH